MKYFKIHKRVVILFLIISILAPLSCLWAGYLLAEEDYKERIDLLEQEIKSIKNKL